MRVERTDKIVYELKCKLIKKLDTKIGQISTQLNARQKRGLPSDTV